MRREQPSFLVKEAVVAGLVIWFFVSGFYFFYHQQKVKRGLLALSNWLLDLLLWAVVATLSALWRHKVGPVPTSNNRVSSKRSTQQTMKT